MNWRRRLKCFLGFHWRLMDDARTFDGAVMIPGKAIPAYFICGWCNKELT
mgnify:CR=1 FL=1